MPKETTPPKPTKSAQQERGSGLDTPSCSPFESDPVTLLMDALMRETCLGSPTISAEEVDQIKSMIRKAWPNPKKGEGYPDHYMHATIHVDPQTGHMTSEGDHEVRHWLKSRMVREGNLSLLANA